MISWFSAGVQGISRSPEHQEEVWPAAYLLIKDEFDGNSTVV